MIKSFDYSRAIEYLRVEVGSINRLSEALNIKSSRISAWKHNRSQPVGDEVLLLISESYERLGDEQFKECLK